MSTELLWLLGLRASSAEPKANLVTPLVGSTRTTGLPFTWPRCFVGQVESNRLAKLRCLSLRRDYRNELVMLTDQSGHLMEMPKYLLTGWHHDCDQGLQLCAKLMILLTLTCLSRGQGATSQGALFCPLLISPQTSLGAMGGASTQSTLQLTKQLILATPLWPWELTGVMNQTGWTIWVWQCYALYQKLFPKHWLTDLIFLIISCPHTSVRLFGHWRQLFLEKDQLLSPSWSEQKLWGINAVK